jgi:MATE family multidrug resistance protein
MAILEILLPAPDRARRIVALAAPVIFAMLTQTAVNLVDTALVGRLLDRDSLLAAVPGWTAMPLAARGEAVARLEAAGTPVEALDEVRRHVPAFATMTPLQKAVELTRIENLSTNGVGALGYSLVLLWFVGGFLSSISVGTQATTARRFGAGDMAGAGQALSNSLIVASISGLAATLVFYPLIPAIFRAVATPDVAAAGTMFLQPRFIGVFTMVTTASYKSFFDGIGKTYIHLVAAVVMNVTNIFLAWCLIWGNLGLPRMELAGAAWAAVLATYIGLGIMIVFSLRPASVKTFHHYRLRANANLKVMWTIVRLSVPSGVATLAVMSGFGFFIWTVNRMDLLAGNHPAILSAATKIIIDVQSVSFISCIAFGTATATLVGQSLGAGRPEDAEGYGWDSVKLGMYLFTMVGATIVVFPAPITRLFTNDPLVVEAARHAMRLTGLMEPMVAAALILSQAHFGAGNSRFVMLVEITLHFTCMIPLAYLAGVLLDGGLAGVFASPMLYGFLLAAILGWKFREGKWKSIRI